ncbi:hypothetical protein B0J14DRAFT_674371 [Halenospora varia]|nr:hypothetical protein B0J14DRAFT_674371 [Halenospora varia]
MSTTSNKMADRRQQWRRTALPLGEQINIKELRANAELQTMLEKVKKNWEDRFADAEEQLLLHLSPQLNCLETEGVIDLFSSDLDKLYGAGERFLKEQWYLTGEAERKRNGRRRTKKDEEERKKPKHLRKKESKQTPRSENPATDGEKAEKGEAGEQDSTEKPKAPEPFLTPEEEKQKRTMTKVPMSSATPWEDERRLIFAKWHAREGLAPLVQKKMAEISKTAKGEVKQIEQKEGEDKNASDEEKPQEAAVPKVSTVVEISKNGKEKEEGATEEDPIKKNPLQATVEHDAEPIAPKQEGVEDHLIANTTGGVNVEEQNAAESERARRNRKAREALENKKLEEAKQLEEEEAAIAKQKAVAKAEKDKKDVVERAKKVVKLTTDEERAKQKMELKEHMDRLMHDMKILTEADKTARNKQK